MTRLPLRVPEDTEGQTPTPRGTTEPSAFGPLALHAGGQEHPPHRSAATLPKVKVDDGPCNACEHDFTLHAGRQATRKYTFTDREIESVLLSLGKGVSYNRPPLPSVATLLTQ